MAQSTTITTRQKGVIGQFLLYAGVGVIGTIGHYTTLIILVEFWAVDPVIASCLGFVVGALINYVLNYHFTFQSDKRHREALTKFLIVATAGALINGGIMYVGVENTRFNYLIVQIFATVVVLMWNFIVNKLWTFTHTSST
jgi:putative flippase GtrA